MSETGVRRWIHYGIWIERDQDGRERYYELKDAELEPEFAEKAKELTKELLQKKLEELQRERP